MYEVQWTHPAVTDLRGKVCTALVRRHLLDVARSALDRHHPPWGGRVADLYWRRGVTAQDELNLDDDELGGTHEHAYDFVLVYERAAAQLPRLWVVLAVLTNAELVEALGTGISWVGPPARGTTNGTTRRSRVTRRPGGASGRR